VTPLFFPSFFYYWPHVFFSTRPVFPANLLFPPFSRRQSLTISPSFSYSPRRILPNFPLFPEPDSATTPLLFPFSETSLSSYNGSPSRIQQDERNLGSPFEFSSFLFLSSDYGILFCLQRRGSVFFSPPRKEEPFFSTLPTRWPSLLSDNRSKERTDMEIKTFFFFFFTFPLVSLFPLASRTRLFSWPRNRKSERSHFATKRRCFFFLCSPSGLIIFTLSRKPCEQKSPFLSVKCSFTDLENFPPPPQLLPFRPRVCSFRPSFC